MGAKPALKKRSKAQNSVNKAKDSNNTIQPKRVAEEFIVEEHELKKPAKNKDLEQDPFGWDQVKPPVSENTLKKRGKNTLKKKEKNFETLNEDR